MRISDPNERKEYSLRRENSLHIKNDAINIINACYDIQSGKPSTSNIIKSHHYVMENDPERMSTNFVEGIIGRTYDSQDGKHGLPPRGFYFNNKGDKLTEAELLAEHKQFMEKSDKYGRFVEPDYEERKKKQCDHSHE